MTFYINKPEEIDELNKHIHTKDKDVLEYAYKMNWLNPDGLREYIKWLREERKDHSERIKEITKEKGLHKEGKE